MIYISEDTKTTVKNQVSSEEIERTVLQNRQSLLFKRMHEIAKYGKMIGEAKEIEEQSKPHIEIPEEDIPEYPSYLSLCYDYAAQETNFCTVQYAAKKYDIPERTLREWCQKKEVVAVQGNLNGGGKFWVISEESLKDYISLGFTVAEVSEYTEKSERTIQRYCQTGKSISMRRGKSYRIWVVEVEGVWVFPQRKEEIQKEIMVL